MKRLSAVLVFCCACSGPTMQAPETSVGADTALTQETAVIEDAAEDDAVVVVDASVLDTNNLPDVQTPPQDTQATMDVPVRDVVIDTRPVMDVVTDVVVADTPAESSMEAGPMLTCAQCLSGPCQTAYMACNASVFCVERLRCFDRCPRDPNPADCFTGCNRAWPSMAPYSALRTCLQNNCAGACSNYR